MNILDLSILNKKTWIVKLPNEEKYLHIKKPSHGLIIKLMQLNSASLAFAESMEKLNKNNDIQNRKSFQQKFSEQQMDIANLTFECTLDILNSNIEGIKFDQNFINIYFDLESCGIIISEFSSFAAEVIENPN